MRLRLFRLTASAVPLLALFALLAAPTQAHSPDLVLDSRRAIEPDCGKPTFPPGGRDREFLGWWHDAGELWLHTSNFGFVGDWGSAPGEPSAEWPAGSGYEHLYAAGLWVGARAGDDTLVSTAVYNIEFLAPADDPVYTIYESASGAPGGEPDFDDDSDGSVDEDRLDGIDNDLDGATDEDYAAISDEMFACVYFDTTEIDQVPPEDIHAPMGLEVYETSYEWSRDLLDDFVRIRYEVTNIGQEVLEEVYLGIMADPDVGYGADAANNYLDDRAAYLDKDVPEALAQERVRLQMAYCCDEPGGADGTWDGYIGFLILDHPTDPDGIVAPASVGPLVYRSWYAGPDFPRNDPTRYRFMSQPMISPPSISPQDWRFLLSVGPFDELAPGETTFLEIAIVCGQGLRGLVDNAASISSRLEDATTLRHLEEPSGRTGDDLEGPTLALAPPAPNPTRASAEIAFALPDHGPVELSVLSPGGRLVATLVDGDRGPGEHVEVWDGRTSSGAAASSGVYLVRLRAGGREAFRKLVLIR
jgi:hypothetical protein